MILDCKVVNDKKKSKVKKKQLYLEPTVDALVEILGLDETDIRARLEGEETKDSQYQILKSSCRLPTRKI